MPTHIAKRDGTTWVYNPKYQRELIRESARTVLSDMTDHEIAAAEEAITYQVNLFGQGTIGYEEFRNCIRAALATRPEVLTSYLAAHDKDKKRYFEEICERACEIEQQGDKSSGSIDSSLCSTKRALIVDSVEKTIYRNFHLTDEEKQAFDDGFIYIHDMGARRDMVNCGLFDMERVLIGGFTMGNIHYEEPASLREAFDVIASVTITAAAQIYGGFTIPQIDNLLSYYAAKSHRNYLERYTSAGLTADVAEKLSLQNLQEDFALGFKSLELKFNTIISPRGDYPFITVTFGLCKDEFAQMAVRAALDAREKGQGAEGFKRPVLFPKLVFLFDKDLHAAGKPLHGLFEAAVQCSAKVMYPEFLSLTGGGFHAEMYTRYGEVVSPMCCRAFLSPWYERGGMAPADDQDKPVFVGRFNFGVVSLNLPMILQKCRREGLEFHPTLDHYLERIRNIHKTTKRFLAQKKAGTNPLCFTQGGFYGGTLAPEESIAPLLESATASFGFTALNELQRLFNGKSLYDDGAFAHETIAYINDKVQSFQEEDKILYTVYGTPAESLCGRQVQKFRAKYGIIKNVSDRDYFSNSFHCHVSEDITPIEKQEAEHRFWDFANGGKIQYIRFTVRHNVEALQAFVLHAMSLGLYEGINMSLAYCDRCGHEWEEQQADKCPDCGSSELTKIERMCGFLAYTRYRGDTRLNPAKMAEIKDRKSM